MIILNELNKKYSSKSGDITALKNINLHVNKAEIFGIIGKSGAGKSTLIRCVNLLEKPTTGEVFINNQALTHLPTEELRLARRKMGMIFQQFNLLSSRTVYENIALPMELAKINSKTISNKINSLLELIGLSHKKKEYPERLSGGQKQRVAIARALASDPLILLSDESTSALDPETTLTILDLLKRIRDELKLTILLITHEMSVIKACCDRVALLEQGEIVEENEVGEFFSRPKTAIVKSFVSSALTQTLPHPIADHLRKTESERTHPVWRLYFMERTATQPIISQLINQFKLRINILQANVEYIKKHPMGIMIIAISGQKKDREEAILHLKNLGVQIEVIGHVPNDIIPFA